jgi:fibronectin-binding autotransporter adhesin
MRALDVVRLRFGVVLLLAIGAGALNGASAALADAPTSTSAPSIAGVTRDGGKLKAERGTWEGAKPIVYSYGWSRCDASGGECAALASANRRTYKLGHEDVGHTLRVTVTAIGEGGSTGVSSLASDVIAAAPLLARKHPKITGSASDGQLLSAGSGTWKGTPPQSFAYQWQSCPKGKGACSSIEGATASSYRVATAQIGHKLRVVVTASNVLGAASSTSSASKPVTAGAPVSLQAPAIAGGLQEGQTLTASTGEWAGTGPLAYSYQWLRCSSLLGCDEIAGATSASYTAGVADLLSKLAVVVTATNAQGSARATSDETSPILGILPANTALPSISGLLQDGQLLNVSPGSWSGSQPISYSYEWKLCNALGNACEAISGASGSSLKLDPSEIGKTLAVVVTATNAAGSTSATSSLSGLIAALLPANTSLPTIAGTLKLNQLLSATSGSWSGSEPISYAYQWQLCVLGTCTNIAKATSSTFLLGALDVANTLRVIVTATNAAGSVSATSAATGLIAGLL